MLRIGHGFDIHKFGGARPLILGGVQIPYITGVTAHSDGDVMIHALIDALLGAVGHNDIGTLFPDTDMQYDNIDSRRLLRMTWRKIVFQNYLLGNIDITVILQNPKIKAYTDQMSLNLASDLQVEVTNINIKATTTETLGCLGRSEGIACMVTVLLMHK